MSPRNPHSDTLTAADDDGRYALRMERRLGRPPAEVWDALTRPERLAHWFPSEVRVELVQGGAVEFVFPAEAHGAGEGGEAGDAGAAAESGMTGVVTDLDEPRLFAFTWGEDHLRWEIAPDPETGGALLTLVHTFGDRFGAPSFGAGWHLCLTALGAHLDGDAPDPAVETVDKGELHEAYLEQFDLGGGEITGTRTVRFERQLVRDAEAVWAELTQGVGVSEGLLAPVGLAAEGVPPGPVTEVRAPVLCAYASPAGGSVRWKLGAGTGYGARLVLTHTGAADARAALAAWHARLELLAGRLLEG
ncbi:SRPBCC family protein [Streptomyces flavofungini]|uniref:SRPBCC family protein n=1 Tax=Streptomyces flavofungini TaxID=68200 RepID=UPI0025B15C94|nr:SRPBCC family protein [Streptomyces flavofungini]WJV47854.1 SRPBCC family protein [Streptomyces flavofungini]